LRMEKFTVLIEARPFCAYDPAPLERLKNAGMDVIDMRGAGMQDPRFVAALEDADAVLCGNDLRIDAQTLGRAPRVKAIAKLGAGLDTIDIDAATRNNVIVFHTPGANNQAVADHTFALILGVARKLVYCDRSLREKRWEHTKVMGLEIWQKTLGLIGLGSIGRCVALRAQGFQMKVVAHDPYWPVEFAAQHEISKMEIDELLQIADIVSIHAPLTPENKGLIDKRALNLMKPSAILINAARGGIVDEIALCEALKNRVIAGAGIDVFEHEPPTDSPLLELDNVILTPHTAAFTFEGMNNMSIGVAEQLVEYHSGNKPRFTVNPEVWDRQKALR
jgi:D-3-phosphoglycerate dehydrogenase